MAEENTITTIFKADISQFSSSAQQLNQYVRTVNSEFNLATASMDKWSDNADGLQAKLKQLNGVLQAQKAKLKPLENQYAQMVKEGKENSVAGKKLYETLIKQQTEVKKTEKEIGHYSKSLNELEKAGVKTKQELQSLTKAQEEQGKSAGNIGSKIAGGLGKAIGGIATATAGAVTGFFALAESTRESRKELAQLETSFENAGHSAEVADQIYTDFNAVLGDTAKTTEAMQQMARLADNTDQLNELVNIGTGVYARFGNAIPIESLMEASNEVANTGQLTGALTDAINFAGASEEEFQAKLDACNSEQERTKLILETLNGLYGEAGKQYKENNKDIIEAEKAQTRLTVAMAELGAIAEPIMTMLKNAIAGLLEAIKPFVELVGNGLRSAFEGSSEGAKQFAEGLTGIVNVLLQKITDILPKVVELVLQLIPTLIDALLQALPQLITTLGDITTSVIQALGQLLPRAIQSIIDAIPLVVEALMKALPQIMLAIVEMGTQLVQALPTLIDNLVSMIPSLINTFIDTLISYYPKLFDCCIELLNALVDAIPKIIEALVPQIPKIVNTIIDGLLRMLPVLLQACIKLLMAIVDAIPTIITSLVKEVPKIVTTIVTTLTSRIGDLINGAIQLFMGILEAIPQICMELIKEIPTIIATIVKGLLEGIPQLIEAGGQLLAGLIQGLLDPRTIWNAIKSLGNSILNGIKSFFGIKSPSTLFRDQIGKNLALGIGEGFEDEMGAVTKDMVKSMDKITPELNVGGVQLNGNSTLNQLADLIGSKIGGNVVNNYTIENSFKGMETTKYALHKSNMELKKILG